MTISDISTEITSRKPRTQRRSIADLLAPLDKIVEQSSSLVINHEATFEVRGESYGLPRYLFVGPNGGDAPIHIGIFAGIHGDEPEGSYAVVQFIKLLEANPQLAKGYYLSFYPVCNPSGFEDDTRFSRNGKDLNREFWKNSSEPEVRHLQTQLISHSFHGIISLHTDDTGDGFYGIARGATLTKHLIEPALRAAERLLARDVRPVIDGFKARNGIIYDTFEGILSAPPRVRPHPFEIVLEAPASPPAYQKEAAFIAALQSILSEYRKFIAYAPNL